GDGRREKDDGHSAAEKVAHDDAPENLEKVPDPVGLIDASDPQQDIDAHQDGVNKKEVVTGHQRDCHQEGIKQKFFLLHDLFQSDAQQRKQDDTHVELRMAFNLIKGVGTERVEDSSGQHVVTLLFHIKTVTGEGNADQIDLKKGQQTV